LGFHRPGTAFMACCKGAVCGLCLTTALYNLEMKLNLT
jgi:hypothetical protein